MARDNRVKRKGAQMGTVYAISAQRRLATTTTEAGIVVVAILAKEGIAKSAVTGPEVSVQGSL